MFSAKCSRRDSKTLLKALKDRKTRLSLNVYQKNTRAICFYQREGFKILCEGLDEDTGEKDYKMIWKRKWEVSL